MTTNAAISVTSDDLHMASTETGNTQLNAYDLDRVHVSFPAEDGMGPVCLGCGEVVTELHYGENLWVHEHGDECDNCGGTIWLGASGTWHHQGGSDPVLCDGADPDDYDGDLEVARPEHTPSPDDGPGTWCNSASVTVDQDDDAVHVSISVGDPRGAFVMTLRQVDRSGYCKHCGHPIADQPNSGLGARWMDESDRTWTCLQRSKDSTEFLSHEPDGQRLLLHVPDPSNGMLHMPLTKLHDGTFLVGS